MLALFTAAAPASAATTPALACTTSDVVCDLFDRTTTTAWGSAEKGGAWTHSSGAPVSVSASAGSIASPAPGRTSIVSLPAAVPADSQSTFDVTVPALPSGGSGIYLSFANRVSPAGAYAVRLQVAPSGATDLQLVRMKTLTSAMVLSSKRLAEKASAGSQLRVEFELTGSTEVSLAAKAWPMSGSKPDAWNVTATDVSAERVTKAGTSALTMYAAQGGNAPAVRVEALSVRPAVVTPPAPTVPAPTTPTVPAPTTPTVPAPTTPALPAPTTPTNPTTVAGPRGTAGAAAPGTLSYAAPATAIYVAKDGNDANPGTSARPVLTFAAALRLVPNGGTIVARAGSYHEEVLVPPQKRVTIQPASNEAVWLDGSKVVDGWRADGKTWVVDNWKVNLDSSPTYTKGAPDSSNPGWQFVNPQYPMAAHPDQVWVGGTQLTEVATRAEVGAGTFYVDGAKSQLVIGTSPTGKTVQASTLTQALSIRSAGSIVRGIGVRHYATSVPQMGTVIVAAADVAVTDVTIRDNSTTGLYSWGLRTALTRVSVINNGLLGVGASTADGLTVKQLLSVGNNSERFNRAPVSGAFKVTRSRGVTVVDSDFIDNLGQGPWFDESVYGITFTGNDVIGNTGYGVLVELSDTAVVADNIVARNGLAGITIVNSGNVSVWNNTAIGNERNIAIVQDSRRASNVSSAGHDPRQPLPDPTVPWITRNTVVVNNVIGDATGNCLVCVEDRSKEFTGAQMLTRSDGNVYSRTSTSAPAAFAIWSRGSAGNPSTFKTLADFGAATGRDGRSVLYEGSSVVAAGYGLTVSPASTVGQPLPANVAAVSRLTAGLVKVGAQPY